MQYQPTKPRPVSRFYPRKSSILLTALLPLLLLLFHNSALSLSFSYTLEGLDRILLKNTQIRLDGMLEQNPSNLDQMTVQHIYQQAPAEIKKALAPYGYFAPHITSTLFKHGNQWSATFRVRPGHHFVITDVQVELSGDGQKDSDLQALLQHFPLRVGEYFSNSRYLDAKQKLLTLSSQKGYIKATFKKNQVWVQIPEKKLRIVLQLNTGKRYYFGKISIHSHYFSQNFIQHFLTFQSGEAYCDEKLRATQLSLSDSDLFQEVDIIPQIEAALREKKQHIPIQIRITPNKGRQYLFGLGYGSDTGLRSLLGINLRHMSEDGQRLKAMLRISQIQSNLSAHYIIPGSNPKTDQYSITATLDEQKEKVGNNDGAKIVLAYAKNLEHWQQTIALNALYDRSIPINAPQTQNFLLYPSASWLHATGDNLLRPTNGNRINITLLGSSRSLLSKNSFLQCLIDLKNIRKLRENDRLILRSSLGYMQTKDINNLPLPLQFFAGGVHSIRGYHYKTLGPGNTLFTLSAEWQYHVYRSGYLGVFWDLGNASNHFSGTIQNGVGISANWLSPIGAIALALARPLNAKDRHWILQFSIGPEL